VREAEEQWRRALAERPDFLPGWQGLAELYQAGQRWADLERLAQELEARPAGEAPAALMRARALLACRQFAGARQVLDSALRGNPNDAPLWVFLSYALLQEGRDLARAEGVLQRILELDPDNAEARNNLTVLQRLRAAA
jgi:Flp pilus assembly protein TadD